MNTTRYPDAGLHDGCAGGCGRRYCVVTNCPAAASAFPGPVVYDERDDSPWRGDREEPEDA